MANSRRPWRQGSAAAMPEQVDSDRRRSAPERPVDSTREDADWRGKPARAAEKRRGSNQEGVENQEGVDLCSKPAWLRELQGDGRRRKEPREPWFARRDAWSRAATAERRPGRGPARENRADPNQPGANSRGKPADLRGPRGDGRRKQPTELGLAQRRRTEGPRAAPPERRSGRQSVQEP